MARTRSLKPGFFQNETLSDLPFEARLLFAGLWTIADRAGRLEDRPKRIRAAIFPYDDLDADQLLWMLHEKGFITRYALTGNNLIQIVNFLKHQNPHRDEKPSTIEAPNEHSTRTMQAPCSHDASSSNRGTSTALTLNPVTGNYNPEPDSLKLETGGGNTVPLPVPHAIPIKEPRGYALDELYLQFRVEFREWGAAVIDSDFYGAAWEEWLLLDYPQKSAAIAAVQKRRMLGLPWQSSENKHPRWFLKAKEWQRDIKPPPRKESREERQRRELRELEAKESKRRPLQ